MQPQPSYQTSTKTNTNYDFNTSYFTNVSTLPFKDYAQTSVPLATDKKSADFKIFREPLGEKNSGEKYLGEKGPGQRESFLPSTTEPISQSIFFAYSLPLAVEYKTSPSQVQRELPKDDLARLIRHELQQLGQLNGMEAHSNPQLMN